MSELIISEDNRLIAKNSVFMGIRMIIVMLISLYATRRTLCILGVVDYGIFNVVAGFVTMFSFINNSMSSATQRYYNYELGKKGVQGVYEVYQSAFIIHIVIALIIVLASELCGMWYIKEKLVIPEDRINSAVFIFHTSVITTFFTVINVPYSAAIIAYEKMDFYAIASILDATLKLLILFLIPIISYDNLELYGVMWAMISAIIFLLYFLYAKKTILKHNFSFRITPGLTCSMIKFSGWRLIDSVSYMLREQGVNLVLNAFFGPVVNAAKGISNQINNAIQAFLSNITTPVKPQLTQAYASGNIERSLQLTIYSCKFTTLAMYLLCLPIIFGINRILGIWIGTNIPDYAASFTVLLLISNLLGTFVFPLCSLIQANGNIKKYQIFSGLSNILTVPLAYLLLLLNKNPNIVFVSLIITSVLNTFVGLLSVRSLIDFSVFLFLKQSLSGVGKVILLTLPIMIVLTIVCKNSTYRLVLIFFTSFTYNLFITYLVGLSEKEREVASQLISKFINKIKR